jgi:FKBP-type peptidyl-prolyl cis-trans isomerase/DnaJ domain
VATNRDYYSVLQVNRSAGDAEIEAAYKRLAKLYDPAISRKPRAPARWAEISEAYETLSDRQKRMAYDRRLSRTRSSAAAGPQIDLPPFLTGPYALVAAAIGLIVVALVGLVLASVLSGDDEPAVVTQPTITIGGSPSPTPEGQTPRPTPPPGPPEVSGETITTPSGLQYIDIQPGTGATPTAGQTVVAEYAGWLQSDGTLFDSSYNPDRSPFEFQLGTGGVIPAWDEGFSTMQVGGKRRLIAPPELAYGADGQGTIPPNATLIFDVELLEVR